MADSSRPPRLAAVRLIMTVPVRSAVSDRPAARANEGYLSATAPIIKPPGPGLFQELPGLFLVIGLKIGLRQME